MKKNRKTEGIQTLRGSGMLRCEECGQILGYIQVEHLLEGFVEFVCGCGHVAHLTWKRYIEEEADGVATLSENTLSCPECYRPWLTLSDEVRGFAFRIRCACSYVAQKYKRPQREVYTELVKKIPQKPVEFLDL